MQKRAKAGTDPSLARTQERGPSPKLQRRLLGRRGRERRWPRARRDGARRRAAGDGPQRSSSATLTPRATRTAPQASSARRIHGPCRNASAARATSTAITEYQTRSRPTSRSAIASADPTTDDPAGTNCGNSATKNTASLGFAIAVTSPDPNADRSCAAGSLGAPDTVPRSSSARRPMATSPSAPAILTAVKTAADAATTAATPIAAASAHTSTPSSLPAVVISAARRPSRAARWTTSTVATPGVIVSRAATGRNVNNIWGIEVRVWRQHDDATRGRPPSCLSLAGRSTLRSQLPQPPLEQPALALVVRELERAGVGVARLGVAPETPQQLAARGVLVAVVVEREAVDDRQAGLRALRL